MKEFCLLLRQSVKGMNKLSKTYLRWGNPLIFSVAVLTLFCRAFAGKIGIFDNMIILSNDFFELFKNLLCSFYIPALLIEIVVLLDKCDRQSRY